MRVSDRAPPDYAWYASRTLRLLGAETLPDAAEDAEADAEDVDVADEDDDMAWSSLALMAVVE